MGVPNLFAVPDKQYTNIHVCVQIQTFTNKWHIQTRNMFVKHYAPTLKSQPENTLNRIKIISKRGLAAQSKMAEM